MVQDPIDTDELEALDAFWRAANYLTVGQIYLLSKLRLRARETPTGLDLA